MKSQFLEQPRSYKPGELLEMVGIFEPPIDLDMLAKHLDIRVSRGFDFEKMGLSGTIAWADDRSTAEIWVNPLDSKKRQRFTLSHELGHLFLHMLPAYRDAEEAESFSDKPVQFNRDGTTSKVEREANQFSAQLLMPAKMVREKAAQIVKSKRLENGKIGMTKEAFISDLAGTFDVPNQAMEYRLMNLGII